MIRFNFLFRTGLPARDLWNTCSGLIDPTRLMAVRVVTPKSAPARARDKNQNCLSRFDGRVETSQRGKRGSRKAATYCSAYFDKLSGNTLLLEIGQAETTISLTSKSRVMEASLQSS